MMVQIRTIQNSLHRRGLKTLPGEGEVLKYKDLKGLSTKVQEDLKVLQKLKVLQGTSDGNIEFNKIMHRSEAAKILSVMNEKIYNISSIRYPKIFNDTKSHWSKPYVNVAYQIGLINGMSSAQFSPTKNLTVEQALQISENVVGYYNITREDIKKSFNETFNNNVIKKVDNNTITKESYRRYEEKVKHYKFNELYNNKKCATYESVTKDEIINIAVGVCVNERNIKNNDIKTIRKNLFSEEKNLYAKISYVEAISIFNKVRKEILKKKDKETIIYFEDFSEYTEEEKIAISNLVADKIIHVPSAKLKGQQDTFKGQINELILNVAEKYSTVAIGDDIVNLDPKKNPYTSKNYAYISPNVPMESYNMRLSYFDDDFTTPYDMYFRNKYRYQSMIYLVEKYLDLILNVDYKNFDYNHFRKNMNHYSYFYVDDSKYTKYYNYVKSNKIHISGKYNIHKPIIYSAGLAFLIRVDIELTVHHALQMKNLVFNEYDFEYTFKKSNIIIDEIEVSYYINNNNAYAIGDLELFSE